MNTSISELLKSKHIVSQVATIIGGLLLIIGGYITILYTQTRPYYKFNSGEYLNLIDEISIQLDKYKTEIDSMTLGSDSVSRRQAVAIVDFIKKREKQVFLIPIGTADNTSIFYFKYSDFIHSYNNYTKYGEYAPVYEVVTVTQNLLPMERRLQIQRMGDSTYKSKADIAESFHRIEPYSQKPIASLIESFVVYEDKKTGLGQLALWLMLPGLILFPIGLSIWITGIKRDKLEAKRLAALEKFEASDKKEIRPAWIMAQETLKEYFDRNLFQIRLIFIVSVFIMIAGFLLIAVGVTIAYYNPTISMIENASVASGLITELIGATFIVIYNSTIRQAITYTDSLERINSVGMSVTILDSMKDSITDINALNTAKIEVAKLLLTLDKGNNIADPGVPK